MGIDLYIYIIIYVYIYVKSAIFHCLVWLQKGIRNENTPRQISGTIWGHLRDVPSKGQDYMGRLTISTCLLCISWMIMDAKNIVQSFGIQCSNLGILMNFGVMGPQKNAKNKHSWQLNSCRADRHCPSWGTSRILLASCSWLESQLLHWSGYRHHFFGMTWKDSNRKLLKYHTQVVHPPKLVSPPMFRNSRK